MAKILVIDDSKAVLDCVTAWLTEIGHEVTGLTSATSTQRLLRGRRFDLVITDIFMPEIDGLELLNLIRHGHPELPCIAMSSVTGPFGRLHIASRLGAVATLQKPFQSVHLYAAVVTALHGDKPPRPSSPPDSSS